MKKLLYCAVALAGLFAAASCQQESLEPLGGGNAVTFTVQTPTTIATRATTIGDGQNVNQLIYEVYPVKVTTNEDGTKTKSLHPRLYQGETTLTSDGKVNKASLTLDLINDQEFAVLFWAQVEGTGAYNTEDLTKVSYAKALTAYYSNDESLAAFYGVAYVSDGNHVTEDGTLTTGTVKLRRPFAQLNIGTLNDPEKKLPYTVSLDESSVKVTGVSTEFNVFEKKSDNGNAEIEFQLADVPSNPATLTVAETTYEYAAMNYLFAGDNVVVEYNIATRLNKTTEYEGTPATINNTVDNVPLKENFRTNIIGNLLTSKTDYEIIVDPAFDEPAENIVINSAYSDDDLLKALKQNEEHIVIDLAGEETKALVKKTYNVDVTSYKAMAFGGEDTKSITINANGNTINFNLNDSDWSHVSLVNDDAIFIINDANLTTSGYNSGHWKRVCLHFASDVELNDVTTEQGLGFKKNAALNNVKVDQKGENYAIWIWSQGQTVTLDKVEVVAAEGRAVKIADEDADVSKVTLNVSGSTFTTKDKAAVLVTSTSGADVVWGEGNNIENVAADKVNAVWVDEEREDSYENVTVTGAAKILEGSVVIADGFYKEKDSDVYIINSVAGIKAFATSVNDGTTYKDMIVKLDADLDLQNDPWTPIGPNADAANKFEGTFDGQDHIISNLKVATAKGYTAAGLFGSLNGTAKNFTIDGASVSHLSTGAATDNGIAVVAGSLYSKGHVENVTVLNATVSGNRYVGAIAGYVYGNIKNCMVKDVTLTATPDKETGSYDNGDKVGAIAGYFSYADGAYVVTGNVVENATIVGYRDMGVVVGTANGADAVSGNTVKGENFVTVDRNFFYGDKDDNAGEVVGRITAGNLGQNTVEGTVTITHPVASAEINAAIKDGGDYTFEKDVNGQASSTNGYGKTGITQSNGGTIDGNGHVLEVPGANSTWDSAINTTGGTIKNLTVAAGFRGIFISHNSTNCSKVYIENVVIDGPVYTISCDQGTNNGLEAVGSTFNGWTSYAGTLGEVKFTECSFGEGAGYSFCRPYAPTTFVECEFEAGYQMDPRAAVVFVDCTVDGQALTTDNLSSLVTSNIQNVTSVNATEQFAPGAWVDDEGKYTATSETGIENAIKAGASEVNLVAGEYSFPAGSVKSGTTINCEEGVVFKGTSSLNVNGATVVGGTFQNKSGYAVSGTINGTFKNCTFDSGEALRWCYTNPGESVVFENCVIKTNFRGFHFDTMDGNVTFKNCEINGFNAYGGAGTVTFEGCTFGCDKSSYNGLNIYANTVLKDCTFLFKSGKTNFVDMEGEGQTLSITNCRATLDGNPVELSEYVGGSKLSVNTVTIDGVQLNK